MMSKKFFDFGSAYAQLILMVFLPITLLAAVGAYLVEKESRKVLQSEQQTMATAALIRYEPIITKLLPTIISKNNVQKNGGINLNQDSENLGTNSEITKVNKGTNASTTNIEINAANEHMAAAKHELNNTDLLQLNKIDALEDVQNQIGLIFASMNNEQHVNRVAVIDEQGNVIASSDANTMPMWHPDKSVDIFLNEEFISGVSTAMGSAYGYRLGSVGDKKYWLFVDMDNQPLIIARLRVWLGLGLTGLFTLLILLLSLNVYAKRWIVPIYDLRLHLQHITPDNMYHPVTTDASGELNQLQQDLVKTLRRLYGDFQGLKDHADQTEDDLRDAFDEMEMQNIFIREARDQAVSSSQAKSAFLANISHELRTPLNSIDGFINLLARHGNLNAEQDLYVQTIRKSSAHLLALVNDVLDFSKIEAGKLELDKHEFSLYAAIYDVMDMLSPLASEKGLRMAVLYYNDVPNTIIGDALRVKQVLTNLVGNAIKFTDVGEVVVRVGLDEATNETTSVSNTANDKRHSGDMIHIAIQDTGQGISENAKAQLFRSFSQGDLSITRQYGGTGLGLVISKQLTRLMGGKIGFYDNAEQYSGDQVVRSDSSLHNNVDESNQVVTKMATRTGATFWFSIPAHVDIDDVSDVKFGANLDEGINTKIQLPVLRPFTQSNDNDKPFEVLVWISHASSLQVFIASVRPLNINVTTARSLAGALERLKEQSDRWDWVVFDGGDDEALEERAALLKQIRLHYQGKLAIYGYQVALDATLLERYKASGLYQPLDKRQLYALLDTSNAHVSTIVSPPIWQGVKILAVDDHLPNLLVLDALLSELGIEVITANSGYDAVDIVSKHLIRGGSKGTASSVFEHGSENESKIDLIFMDVQMPRMSGDEAAEQIRQLEADINVKDGMPDRRMPIIALTAQDLVEEKEKLIAAGIDDYVGKPISRPQLLQILQRWLGKGGDAPASSLISHDEDVKSNAHSSYVIDMNSPLADNDSGALIVDWKDALARSANKPKLAHQLLTMMQNSVPDEIRELEEAWQNSDRKQLAQIAHRILGASRYTGVPQIRNASQSFEDKCLLNVQHNTPPQFILLEEYYDALIASLKALQALDLEACITQQKSDASNDDDSDKGLSENDMTWKMI